MFQESINNMATFEIDNSIADMIKKIDKFATSEEVYKEMISAGQKIMKSSIESGASKHVETGKMARSLISTEPVKNADGEWVGRVKFSGSDGVHRTKKGKKYDITNWLKAFRIEYGTSKQKAEPFVRPAIKGCESEINAKWKQIYERKLKELQ